MLIVAINYLYADPDLNSHLDGTGSWTRLDSKIKIYLYILQKKRSSSFSCISFALRQILFDQTKKLIVENSVSIMIWVLQNYLNPTGSRSATQFTVTVPSVLFLLVRNYYGTIGGSKFFFLVFKKIELRPRDFRSIFLLINPLWASVTEPHTF